MKIYRDAYEKLNTRTTVALGCFDGVHTAHASVIRRAVEAARENGTRALVWCFAEPPKNAFLPTPVPLITGLCEKTRLIEALGADILVCPDFTREIAGVGAREFVRDILCGCAGAVHLVSGRNYSFGRGGEGNCELLSRISGELGIEYTIVEDVTADGIVVSSSEIRRAVGEGELESAARLLGRSFSLTLERKDGSFLADPGHLAPPDGKYRVRLRQCSCEGRIASARLSRENGVLEVTLDRDIDEDRITLEIDGEEG